jgi:hypothetical protein
MYAMERAACSSLAHASKGLARMSCGIEFANASGAGGCSLPLTYSFHATALRGVVTSQSRTVTFTILSGA